MYPDKAMEEPELDNGSAFILQAFHELSACRQGGFSGAEPLMYSEIEAYINTTHTPLRPDEVKAIKAMDSAWLKALREVRDWQKQQKGD